MPAASHSPPKRNMKIKRKEVIYMYIDTSKPSQLFFPSCCSARHSKTAKNTYTDRVNACKNVSFFYVVFLSLSLVFSVGFQALMHMLFHWVYNRHTSLAWKKIVGADHNTHFPPPPLSFGQSLLSQKSSNTIYIYISTMYMPIPDQFVLFLRETVITDCFHCFSEKILLFSDG